ncbi:hypothetical protein PINS_up011985 [Pythium insidiosum]|nr:hypothetical protein PINS_up011985 [Pythium insidiosum]
MHVNAPTEPLQAALQQHRQQRAAQLERDNPFSWRRFVISLTSYSLLLSDAFRSGFAVTNLNAYAVVEPSAIVEFGPYAYPGIHLTLANATRETLHPSWLYKFDTTSITMRSVVQALQVASWPPCLLYRHDAEGCSTTRGFRCAPSSRCSMTS